MGETADHEEKNGGATKVEKKEKHKKKEKLADDDVGEKEGGKGEEKGKDKKKKDKECKDKEGGENEEKKKKNNPEDKSTDPAKLKLKLEKMDAKMQAMAVKREEILKMISEAEKNAANPSGAAPRGLD